MMRFLIASGLFLFLFALQTSFINSLPGVLALTPLFFAINIYLIQHHSFGIATIWLLSFGLLLDILHIGDAPLETLSYGLAAFAALLTSRNVFSNRSLYGIMGCGLFSFVTLSSGQIAMTFLSNLNRETVLLWDIFFHELVWKAGSMVVLLILFFQFAHLIRTGLIRSFLLSHKHETW